MVAMPLRVGASLTLFSVACVMTSPPVSAQDKFPSRPIEVILPVPPGGGTDIALRQLIELLEPDLGQKIVPVNKPGASGALGMTAMVQSKPDGHTLGAIWNAPLTMTPHIQNVPYGPQDYVAVALMTSAPLVMCTKPDFPANDGKALIEELRRNPNKYTYGTDGAGATVHLASERIFQKFGIKARAVPFTGAGETLKSILGGHIDIYGGAISTIQSHAQAGAVKCLLLTSKEKNAAVPQATSLTELGVPELATYVWHGILAPKGTPPDRVAILEAAFVKAIKTDKFREFMQARGAKAEGLGSAEFRKLIDSENKAMGDVAASLGMARK